MPSTLRTVCRFNYHNSYVYLCDNESITPLTLYLWMFGCTKTKKEKKIQWKRFQVTVVSRLVEHTESFIK